MELETTIFAICECGLLPYHTSVSYADRLGAVTLAPVHRAARERTAECSASGTVTGLAATSCHDAS